MDCLRTSFARLAVLLWAWPALAFGADLALGADGPEIVAGIKSGAGDQAKAAEPPLAKYLTVTSPVDDLVFGRVKNAVLNLESQAQQQHRRAVLILEITHGTTLFHQFTAWLYPDVVRSGRRQNGRLTQKCDRQQRHRRAGV